MKSAEKPTGHALLVGSVPLIDTEAVLRAVSGTLGAHLSRLPDGETGVRSQWIGWQLDVMKATPFLELQASKSGYGAVMVNLFVPRSGTKEIDWQFGALGYARAAIDSYGTFARLKRDGVIRPQVKFQISLPTPLAPMTSFVAPDRYLPVEAAYERRMRTELEEIYAVIPLAELAIQWDTAVEFALLERVFPGALAGQRGPIVERLLRLSSWVPEPVELGFHFCYGDAGHKHFKEPDDCGLLAEVANAVAAGLKRSLQWLHLPVPRSRTDADFFRQLAGLRLRPETKLYLGLVHLSDGVTGAQARIAAAHEVVRDFGVATECGFGRRPPQTIEPLLKLHADVIAQLAC